MRTQQGPRSVAVETGEDVVTAARRRIAASFDTADHVAVSFSGGKDSTAVLNLVIEEARRRNWHEPVRVLHWDEEAVSLETEAYVRRVGLDHADVARLEWWCLPVSHRNATTLREGHGTWHPWDPEAEPIWCRPMPPEALTMADFPIWPTDRAKWWTIPESIAHLPTHEEGTTHVLLGIRAAESFVRRNSILSRHRQAEPWLSEPVKGRPGVVLRKSYPIYDWSTEDVWRAPAVFGWDYNRSYDLMEMLGIGHSAQRVAPPFGEQPMQDLYMWAECFPDLWAKMVHRVPGARAAARYAKTSLYAFGGQAIEKPPGTSWPDYIREICSGHDPSVAAKTAARIATLIGMHRYRTHDPILPRTPHPASGISWELLAKIAVKSDTKDRAMGKQGNAEMQARWREQYDAEKAELDQIGARYDA